MNEIELKLLLDARQEKLLRSGPAVRRIAAGRTKTRNLHSVYFDTDDDALKGAAIAIRLRRDGQRWVQTVKKSTNGIAQGLSTPIEDEAELPGPHIDLSRIGNSELREQVIELAGDRLAPTVETEFRRTTRDLTGPGGGRVELAIDIGEVRANGRAEALAEAELEVKAGPQGDIFALARALLTQGPIRFSNRSKSARAGALRDGGTAVEPPRAIKATQVELHKKDSVEAAAVAVLNEIQHQIAANVVATVETDSVDAPHQLRIGLRRLRAALGALRPALGCDELDRLRDRARELGAEVGRLRDLDVMAEEMLSPVSAAAPDEPGFRALCDEIASRREVTGRELRKALAGPEVAGFVLDLAGFVATRRWRAAGADEAALDKPARELAGKALSHRWKALKKRAKGLEDLPPEGRHEVRKEIKKLRYVAEIFEPLYPKKKVAAFRSALKTLQEDFGALNDAAMAEEMLAGPEAPAARDPAAQRAAGRLLGATSAEADRLWPRALGDWQALAKAGPFWK